MSDDAQKADHGQRTKDLQVLVAGAGPVGLTLAAELKRFGVSVRIVDKAPAPTDKSKALVLWSRSLELLERTGKIADYLAAGQPGHGTRISKGRELIAEIDLDGIDSPYPYALMIPQNETERVLGETLAGFGGAVERQVELVAFEDGPGGITATLKHPDGRLEQVTADWLVGCDGAHSTVRHGLGLPFEGSTQPSDWVLADLKVDGLTPDKLDLYWHAEGVLAFFPIVGSRYRVIADLGPTDGAGRSGEPALAEIQVWSTLAARRARPARSLLARLFPHQRAQGEGLWPRPRLPRRRRRPHPQPRRRPGHEHRHAGRLQPRLEARPRHPRRGEGGPPRLLFARAQRRRRHGARQRDPHDRPRHHAQSGRPSRAEHGGEGRARPPSGAAQDVRGVVRDRDRLSESPLTVEGRHAPHGHAFPRAGERCPPEAAGGLPFGAGSDPRFTVLGAGSAATALAARSPPSSMPAPVRPSAGTGSG